MTLIIRTMFWIMVMSGCQVNTDPTILSRIKKMERGVKCPSDSTFYTPVSVKEQCITTALDCVMVELNYTVKAECEGHSFRIEQGVKALQAKMNEWKGFYSERAHRKTCYRVCEEWPEMPFGQFVNNTRTLIQMMENHRKKVT